MHCFMISICDAKSEFNKGTNKSYHWLNRCKELEQLKNISAWKAAAIKVTTKYKKQYQILPSLRKKQQHIPELFLDKVIDFTNEPSM